MNTILPFAPPLHDRAPRAGAAAAMLDPLPMLHPEPEFTPPPEADAETEHDPWHPSLLHRLLSAPTPQARQHEVRSLVQALGFDTLVYGRFTLDGERWLPQAFCTTYADEPWLQRYVCASYHRVDPRLACALGSSLPCIWSVDSLATALAADDTAPSLTHAFVDDLRSTGIASGALLALPGLALGLQPGVERHVVSLGSRRPGTAWLDDARLGQVLTLGICLNELYTRHLPMPTQALPAGVAHPTLSALQRAILDCVAHGLGDKQIAARLSLSLHNVDYHLRQLRRRFAVRNRVQLTQAAQRAGLR
ncbi:MAG: autoinducer binding domain-containing protein [Rhizobacter sp.]|nr:autoinducer binding domain-containing protein [Rhizobacter sp.]